MIVESLRDQLNQLVEDGFGKLPVTVYNADSPDCAPFYEEVTEAVVTKVLIGYSSARDRKKEVAVSLHW